MLTKNLFILAVVCVLLCACQSDKYIDKYIDQSSLDQVVVRLQKEPQRLSPMLYTLPEAGIVMEHMYLSLCDFDPVSGDWVPVLASEMPEIKASKNEDGETEKTLEIEILPEAIWSDGSPITAHDIAFTMKLTRLAGNSSPRWAAWKQMTDNLNSIEEKKATLRNLF